MVKTIFLLLVLASPIAQAQSPQQRIGQVYWLTGCWQQSREGQVVEEMWMAPRAGTMLGSGRTTRGDTAVVEFEHTQILERGGLLVYHAEPSGQAPADFRAISLTDGAVTFENLRHDFPQRVIYRRAAADSVVARVEGERNGRVSGVDFHYARASCTAR